MDSSALPTGASTEATLALIKAKTDNLDVLLSTRAVTGLTDAQLRASAVPVDVSDRIARLLGQVVGNVAHAAADSGNPIKVGGKATLNTAALPTAVTAGQRADIMVDEYGRLRVVVNRPKILGSYKFESGRLTVLAAAHAATAGFFWLINPVGSAVIVYVKKLIATAAPTAVTAFPSTPRITVERITFTGTASGAAITPAKRDSTDVANVGSVRTASTGLTITAGAVIGDFSVPAVLTGVGVAVPIDQYLYEPSKDEDDQLVLRAGEGIVVRQADAGTASDTRLLLVFGAWEER